MPNVLMSVEQVESIVRLIGSAAGMMVLVQDCLLDHHPEGAIIIDCDICESYLPALRAAMDQWQEASVQAAARWGFELDEA